MLERSTTINGLLFQPAKILELKPFFQLLKISRKDKKVDFKMVDLNLLNLNRQLNQFPEKEKEILDSLNEESLKGLISELKRKRNKEKSGIPEDLFIERALLRYFSEKCLSLIPYLNTAKLYHRIQNPKTKNFSISPCNWSQLTPQLSFQIVKNDNQFSVKTILNINGEKTKLGEWKRYRYFIEKEATYYFLSLKDMNTIEWLNAASTRKFFEKESLFLKFVLNKLKENYSVHDHGVFNRKEIRTIPVPAVYISEISGTMLLFTPRFIYEGISVENEWRPEQDLTNQGELFRIYRNKESEEIFLKYLQALHPDFLKQSPKFFYLSFAAAHKKQWFLKTVHQFLEDDVEMIGLDFLQHFRYTTLIPETTLSKPIRQGNDLIYKFQLSFGEEKIKLRALQKTLRSNQNSFLLKDNSIAILSDDWIEKYGIFIKHGRIDNEKISVPDWIYLGIKNSNIQSVLPEIWLKKWQAWQSSEKKIYKIPNEIKATLRPYQQKGFEWMVLLSEIGAGACLADDMGLGKTLQTICFLAYQKKMNSQSRFLIAAPASVLYNWKKEIERFAPYLKSAVMSGVHRDFDQLFNDEVEVFICSYGVFRSDIHQLSLYHWDTVVIDESQNIKNPYAQITKAVYQINCTNKIALSGTPVMNNTFDLYAQLQFLLPNLFPSAEFFEKEYAYPIDHNNDKNKIRTLNTITAPFILKRSKSQVATDLPEKVESIIWCEMTGTQREIYNEFLGGIRKSIFLGIKEKGLPKSMLTILQSIQKLRQICSSPFLLKDEHTDCRESVKVDFLMEELIKLNKEKVLVFSQFKGMLHLVAERLEQEGVLYYHFDGDTPIAERQKMIDQFQEQDNETKVFLISLKAGNSGINLTAAEYVFILDPWWNEAVEQQAINRTHRIGQEKTVMAYKMICSNSIEEKILELQSKKKILSEELVAEEEGFTKKLSKEDIQFLFS